MTDDPDRFMDLQLQHAAQLADQARKQRDLPAGVDMTRTVISLIKSALATYVPDGSSSDAFRLTIDGAFAKLNALHQSIEHTVYAETVQALLGEMRAKFEADGWTPPENTDLRAQRAIAAELAGATILDSVERIQLGELHLRMARDQLRRGNRLPAERELAKASQLLSAGKIPSALAAELADVEKMFALSRN